MTSVPAPEANKCIMSSSKALDNTQDDNVNSLDDKDDDDEDDEEFEEEDMTVCVASRLWKKGSFVDQVLVSV